jgi:hypothetical protein
MLRTLIARTATVALAGSLLVVASPGPSDADREARSWGTISSKNHVLKRGCHFYTYRYRITAPNDDWSAEVFLVRPDGVGLASDAIDTLPNPDRGRRTLQVCNASTTPGTHKLRMKVTYNVNTREQRAGFVDPDRFRFLRR